MVVVVANENHPQEQVCMLVLRVMGGGGGRRAQPPSRTSVGGSFLGVEGVVMLPKSLHIRKMHNHLNALMPYFKEFKLT